MFLRSYVTFLSHRLAFNQCNWQYRSLAKYLDNDDRIVVQELHAIAFANN